MIAPIDDEDDDAKPSSWAIMSLEEAIHHLCDSAIDRGYDITYDDFTHGRFPENAPDSWRRAFEALFELHIDEVASDE